MSLYPVEIGAIHSSAIAAQCKLWRMDGTIGACIALCAHNRPDIGLVFQLPVATVQMFAHKSYRRMLFLDLYSVRAAPFVWISVVLIIHLSSSRSRAFALDRFCTRAHLSETKQRTNQKRGSTTTTKLINTRNFVIARNSRS